MSTLAYAPGASHPAGAALGVERLRLALLWLTGASGALVFVEPSPYEIASLAALGLFVLTGLALRPSLMPLGLLLILINLGYTMSAAPVLTQGKVLNWVLTSWYLGVTALFFAAALGANTAARINALMRGCVVAGAVAALAGVAGYFRLVPGGSDLLLLYDRARGTFKDPNVFGAFMVLPALFALRGVVAGRFRHALGSAALLALFAAALLVSFSRGAWGQMAFASLIVLALSFLTAPSGNQRLRIVLLAGIGAAALTLFMAALLSLDAVQDLLKERLSLSQSYDVGETGRFGRHVLGALLALDVPFGIGPLQFSKLFPEDPHNTYLNAFVSGGWVAGVSLITLVLLTLAFGLRAALTASPWQSATIVVYGAYIGTMAESAIIDTDHWRHAFLQLGAMWGLIAASAAHRKAALAGARAHA